MLLESDIAVLRQVEIFSSFNDEALRLIAFGSNHLNFEEGSELFHNGQTADGGYVVLSGEIKLDMYNEEKLVKSETIKAGNLIGEMALLTRNKRIGTATAITKSETLKIRRDVVYRVLEEYPELAVALQKQIAASIGSLGEQLDKLQQKHPSLQD